MTKNEMSEMILKIKDLFICFIVLLVSNKAIATEQSMDVMIYNDSMSFLFSENLIEMSYMPTVAAYIQGKPADSSPLNRIVSR